MDTSSSLSTSMRRCLHRCCHHIRFNACSKRTSRIQNEQTNKRRRRENTKTMWMLTTFAPVIFIFHGKVSICLWFISLRFDLYRCGYCCYCFFLLLLPLHFVGGFHFNNFIIIFFFLPSMFMLIDHLLGLNNNSFC